MSWQPTNLEGAIFAELPSDEKTRARSYWHPQLLDFHLVKPAEKITLGEWDRIGIVADIPKATEEKTAEDQLRDTFPKLIPSDARLVHDFKKLSTDPSDDHVHARCGACNSWALPTTMLDVRSYPETFEKPILDRRNREHIVGPEVDVIDNELTQRNTDRLDPDFGKIIGGKAGEVTKKFRFVNSRPSVAGYEAAVDLKKGAGFVCSGCWTRWVRGRYKIGGVTYTRLSHITLLGAPQDVVDAHSGRPGWNSPGLTAY